MALHPACSDEQAGVEPVVTYVDQREALRGLAAIHLDSSFLNAGGGVVVAEDLRERVEKRLSDAGLRLIDDEAFAANRGLTDLQIYPSAEGGGSKNGRKDAAAACCRSRVWISALEGVALQREVSTHRLLPIWGGGADDGCSAVPADLSELIIEVVDRFAVDYEHANADEVQPGSPTPSLARID